MSTKKFNRLQNLDRLIRIKATGTPKQLSDKLEVSERTVFRLIEDIRTLGASVAYCEKRQTYYYEEQGVLIFGFQKVMDL